MLFKITSFLNGLWGAAAYLKEQRQEREDEMRRGKEKQEECLRKLRALEKEKQRLRYFEQQAMSWQKSRLLRAYIRASVKAKGGYTPNSEFSRWVTWATNHADQLDPLKID